MLILFSFSGIMHNLCFWTFCYVSRVCLLSAGLPCLSDDLLLVGLPQSFSLESCSACVILFQLVLGVSLLSSGFSVNVEELAIKETGVRAYVHTYMCVHINTPFFHMLENDLLICPTWN